MKISLVTWLGNGNYGTALQSYALYQKLKLLGYDISFLPYFDRHFRLKSILKGILAVVGILQRRDKKKFEKTKALKKLYAFQKEKYEQLSESYRQSRRIIHDLKKQYFCINEYVDNKEYDKLKTFTSEAVRDIESTYSKYNTGNLVIDSFLTNYDTLAAKNHIQFVAKLGVTYNRIPVNDYDLCVILGNMLDNCLKACIANPSSENFIHIAIATTENDKFTIHCENTTAEGTSLEHIHASRQNSLYHGYGLTNIRNTAEKYHGFFTYSVETLFYMDLMIPIIEKSKRIMH